MVAIARKPVIVTETGADRIYCVANAPLISCGFEVHGSANFTFVNLRAGSRPAGHSL